MKGKYATRAESTQARVDLQRRAEAAERRVWALEKKLAEVSVEHDATVRELRAELVKLGTDLEEVIGQREAQVSPVLDETRAALFRLQGERAALRDEIHRVQEGWKLVATQMVGTLVRLGLPRWEATDLATKIMERTRPSRLNDPGPFEPRVRSDDSLR